MSFVKERERGWGEQCQTKTKCECRQVLHSLLVFLHDLAVSAVCICVYLPSDGNEIDEFVHTQQTKSTFKFNVFVCNINYYIFIIIRLLNTLEVHLYRTKKSGNGIESAANERHWSEKHWESFKKMVNNKTLSTLKKTMLMTTTTVTTPLNGNKTRTTTTIHHPHHRRHHHHHHHHDKCAIVGTSFSNKNANIFLRFLMSFLFLRLLLHLTLFARLLSFFSSTRIIYNLRIEHKGLQSMCVHFY